MDLIKENIPVLRDAIQRRNLHETTVIDVFTAFYVLLLKKGDFSYTDDKHYGFLMGCIANVTPGEQRSFWFKEMFSIYEKLTATSPTNPEWLLLQANLIYAAPKSSSLCLPDY